MRGSFVSKARLEDRQLAYVDSAPFIGETYSCEFSDVGIENDSCAVKLFFSQVGGTAHVPRKGGEGQRGREGKVYHFILYPSAIWVKKDDIQTSQSHIPCSRKSQ